MNTMVIGCGRWGTFLSWYLNQLGHSVKLYGRKSSYHMQMLMKEGENKYLKLPDGVQLTTDISNVIVCEAIFISVNSQGLRSLCTELNKFKLDDKYIILCMKGIESDTCKRLSEVVVECISSNIKLCVWLGPGHVQEYIRGIPNCMVIDSNDEEVKYKIINELSGGVIRLYCGVDFVGNEIGAAAKNVIGIAAGILDGMNMKSLKGALMARATREIYRLIESCGGNPISAYGLCHLGDYEATIFSEFSNNRKYGENLVLKQKNNGLAEGVETAKAIYKLAIKNNIEMPICKAVYSVLYENADPTEELSKLFSRPIKLEY